MLLSNIGREWPLYPAGSTDRRNTGVKSICRGLERQGLAWPFIELASYFVQVCLGEDRQVCPLGEVLPQQSIGVLIGAALPGALRIAEVYGDVGCQCKPPMIRKLAVKGKGTIDIRVIVALVPGVANVTVSLPTGETTVQYDEKLAALGQLKSAVEAAGYGVHIRDTNSAPLSKSYCCDSMQRASLLRQCMTALVVELNSPTSARSIFKKACGFVTMTLCPPPSISAKDFAGARIWSK